MDQNGKDGADDNSSFVEILKVVAILLCCLIVVGCLKATLNVRVPVGEHRDKEIDAGPDLKSKNELHQDRESANESMFFDAGPNKARYTIRYAYNGLRTL